MAEPNQQNHHNNCNQMALNRHSGIADNGILFMERYGIQVPFDLECTGCCFAYLRGRNYEEIQTEEFFDRVCFSSRNLAETGANIPADMVNSYVNSPRRGKRGQVRTGFDFNLGERTARPLHDSRTYQLYSPTGNLSVGFKAKARMESIAIDVVRGDELVNIYLNYADAALLELYREGLENPLPSLSQAEVTGYLFLRVPVPTTKSTE